MRTSPHVSGPAVCISLNDLNDSSALFGTLTLVLLTYFAFSFEMIVTVFPQQFEHKFLLFYFTIFSKTLKTV